MTAADTTVKMVQLAHPRADIGVQEFHDHWRHPHATLVRDIRPIRHYVQNHRITSDVFTDSDSTYRGIAECWFDSLASNQGLATDPQYVNHVGPDEPEFVDQSKHLITITTEQVIHTNRGDIAPDAPAGDLYWSDKDAPTYIALWQFVRDHSAHWSREESLKVSHSLDAFRQVINRSVDPTSDIAAVRQFYWPSLTAFEHAVTTHPTAFEDLRATPDSFLFLTHAERIF
ncbi:EthD domain-containing protein [Streptomyces sp. NPDC026672]|uniref:EthD domain-containing protein n=1 Tax=unclassified Streptomyces TaxID=2593676 RepID=UPI0033EF403C